MEHLILAAYVLFFATGFMGGAALLLLGLRERHPLLSLLVLFQVLFLVGLGIVGTYFYLQNVAFPAKAFPKRLETLFGLLSSAVNVAIYLVAILLLRRLEPRQKRRKATPAAAEILAFLVIIQILGSAALSAAGNANLAGARAVLDSEEWHLGSYILTGLAIAALGFSLRGSATASTPGPLGPLIKGYGLCALAFAPLGLLEFVLNNLGLQPWRPLSLDYLFYLGWNLVSMSAARVAFRPREGGSPLLESLSPQEAASFGLTAREVDMVLLIARGLANKEIAAELGIAAATVRTHIYNLYQKVGVRSRVELLNRIRGSAPATGSGSPSQP